MPQDTPENAARPETVRSALTNGSKVTLFGDGRSVGARRYRDLECAYAGEVGGMAGLAASEQDIIRDFARWTVENEVAAAKRAAGQPVSSIEFATITNTLRRARRDFLALKARTKPRQPTLAEQLEADRLARLATKKEAA